MKTSTTTASAPILPRSVNVPGLKCRFCDTPLHYSFVDLGMSPLCESFVAADQLNGGEVFYPLHALVCENCFLVQLDEYVTPEEIFTEYAYFSSYSDSWLKHARDYVETIVNRLDLESDSQVVEVASNDGYLLQYFVERNIPALGIEPAENVARVAIEKGVDTRTMFFSRESARDLVTEGYSADLVIGNNVLAQVPDLNSFVAGLKIMIKPAGIVTMEFPHLMRLVAENQFDTIYHEHFSYFSLVAAERIFSAHGMRIFDVDELRSHGGSLRIYACHDDAASFPTTERVTRLRATEIEAGFERLETYAHFAATVEETKRQILSFLIEAKRNGKRIVGYGAPGKGNTLLNYCGIRTDFLDYTVDRNPYKHGRFLPGTRIPIYPPDKIEETKPDYIFILPWNLKDEIIAQMDFARSWGAKFVVPIPEATIID